MIDPNGADSSKYEQQSMTKIEGNKNLLVWFKDDIYNENELKKLDNFDYIILDDASELEGILQENGASMGQYDKLIIRSHGAPGQNLYKKGYLNSDGTYNDGYKKFSDSDMQMINKLMDKMSNNADIILTGCNLIQNLSGTPDFVEDWIGSTDRNLYMNWASTHSRRSWRTSVSNKKLEAFKFDTKLITAKYGGFIQFNKNQKSVLETSNFLNIQISTNASITLFNMNLTVADARKNKASNSNDKIKTIR